MQSITRIILSTVPVLFLFSNDIFMASLARHVIDMLTSIKTRIVCFLLPNMTFWNRGRTLDENCTTHHERRTVPLRSGLYSSATSPASSHSIKLLQSDRPSVTKHLSWSFSQTVQLTVFVTVIFPYVSRYCDRTKYLMASNKYTSVGKQCTSPGEHQYSHGCTWTRLQRHVLNECRHRYMEDCPIENDQFDSTIKKCCSNFL